MCRDTCVCPRLSAGPFACAGTVEQRCGLGVCVRGFGVLLCILVSLGVSLCVSVSFWVGSIGVWLSVC